MSFSADSLQRAQDGHRLESKGPHSEFESDCLTSDGVGEAGASRPFGRLLDLFLLRLGLFGV